MCARAWLLSSTIFSPCPLISYVLDPDFRLFLSLWVACSETYAFRTHFVHVSHYVSACMHYIVSRKDKLLFDKLLLKDVHFNRTIDQFQ